MHECFPVKYHEIKLKICKKKAFCFVLDDYTSSHVLLLEKFGKPCYEPSLRKILLLDVYKTLNSLNPCVMQNLFKLWETNTNLNSDIPVVSQVTYGTKSLRSFGHKIRNSLPHRVKFSKNLKAFIKIINSWNGVSCNCVVCGWKNFHKTSLDV